RAEHHDDRHDAERVRRHGPRHRRLDAARGVTGASSCETSTAAPPSPYPLPQAGEGPGGSLSSEPSPACGRGQGEGRAAAATAQNYSFRAAALRKLSDTVAAARVICSVARVTTSGVMRLSGAERLRAAIG